MSDRLPDATPFSSACPVCGRLNDDHLNVDFSTVPPTEGDLTVCFGCGSFTTFNADLTQREMTIEEIAMLPDELRMLMQRVRKFWEITNRHNREEKT